MRVVPAADVPRQVIVSSATVKHDNEPLAARDFPSLQRKRVIGPGWVTCGIAAIFAIAALRQRAILNGPVAIARSPALCSLREIRLEQRLVTRGDVDVFELRLRVPCYYADVSG